MATHEIKVQVQGIIDTANGGITWRSKVLQRNKVRLIERKGTGQSCSVRFNIVGSTVAKDGGVGASIGGDRAGVRDGLDPVVIDCLICSKL